MQSRFSLKVGAIRKKCKSSRRRSPFRWSGGPPVDFGIVRARGDDHRRQAGGGRGAGARRGRRGGGARAHGTRPRASSPSWSARTRRRRSTCATRSRPARRPACARSTSRCRPTSTQAELLALVDRLNADDAVRRHPGAVAAARAGSTSSSVLERIDPDKDVDGFHPLQRRPPGRRPARRLWPCTPAGVMELLDYAPASSSRAPTRSSSAAATSSASRWRCSCCSAAPPSRSATRARATSPRSPAAPTCWSRRSAGRA